MFNTSVFAQSDQKVIGKSFNLYGKELLNIDLGNNVNVKKWNNATVRVEMTIEIPNGNNTLLKALVTTGRYNIKENTDAENFTIHIPGLAKKVNYRGVILEEKVSFEIFTPNDVEVNIETPQEEVSTN